MKAIKIKFSYEEEFLAEIAHARPANNVVRITQQHVMNTFQTILLKASFYRDRGGVLELVELTRYIGEVMPGHVSDPSDPVMKKAEEAIKTLESMCEGMDLCVLPGLHELPYEN